MYSKVLCSTISGINGILTYVEVDSSNGLPNFSTVGNFSNDFKEMGDRVHTARKNSDIDIPAKKITINDKKFFLILRVPRITPLFSV